MLYAQVPVHRTMESRGWTGLHSSEKGHGTGKGSQVEELQVPRPWGKCVHGGGRWGPSVAWRSQIAGGKVTGALAPGRKPAPCTHQIFEGSVPWAPSNPETLGAGRGTEGLSEMRAHTAVKPSNSAWP